MTTWFAGLQARRAAYDQALLDAFAPFRDEQDSDDERLVDDD